MTRAEQDRIEPPGSFPVLPLLIHGDAAFAGQGVVAETPRDERHHRLPRRRHDPPHHQQPDRLHHRARSSPARRSTAATWPRRCRRRSSTSTATTPRRACAWPAGVRVPPEVPQGRRHRHGVLPAPRSQRGRRPELHAAADVQGDRRTPQRAQAVRRVAGQARRHHGRRGRSGRSATSRASCRSRSTRRGRRRRCRIKAAQPPKPVGVLPHDPDRGRPGDARRRSSTRSPTYPDDFTPHPKLAKQFEARAHLFADGEVDWATAEALAIGSLVLEGARAPRRRGLAPRHVQPPARRAHRLRHREPWIPLDHLDGAAGRFWVYDSLLSEYAALGFEYGYAQSAPEALVMWEAQFGDFINGAQVIIDQYLVGGGRQVGPAQRPRAAAAARLRRPRSRALLGAHRALPHGGGRGQHPAVQRHHGGAVLPPAAPPGVLRASHAARGVHPEGGPAHEADALAHRRADIRLVPGGARRSRRRRRRRGDAGGVLQRQGGLGRDGRTGRARGAGRQSCASSSSTRCRPSRCWRCCSGATSTHASWCGCRRSPRTWAPGTSSRAAPGGSRSTAIDLRHVARVESGSPATGSKAIHDQELADLMDETFA